VSPGPDIPDDWAFSDEGQRSFEPAYRLPASCWRCETAEPAGNLGLCSECLAVVRDERDKNPAGPHVDVRALLADSLDDFGAAIRGPDLYRCSFVHPNDDLRCEFVSIGTARFPLDEPIVLRRDHSYSLVIDRDTGAARVTRTE
jgi:hypothetical protein